MRAVLPSVLTFCVEILDQLEGQRMFCIVFELNMLLVLQRLKKETSDSNTDDFKTDWRKNKRTNVPTFQSLTTQPLSSTL